MRVRLDLPHADGTTTPVLLERSQDLPGGRRKWTTRSRVPIDGAFQIREVSPRTPPAIQVREGEEDQEADRAPMDGMILEGIASSTSVDWHGTAMSREALEGMAAQFRQGVPYVPAHHRDEWDEVMGTTVEAEVQDSQEGLPAVLMVRTRLYANDPRSTQLVERLQDGLRIGQSIGGWFTEMDVVTNDQEEVESITIRGVELDHLAVTRRPSNPDSYIARLLTDGSQALRAATTRSTVESTIRPGNLRHVWKVVETEDAVHVVFGKAEDHWDGVHPMTPDTEGPQADEPEEESPEGRESTPVAVESTQEGGTQARAATEFQDLPLAPPDTEWDWDTEAQDAILYQGREEDDPDWDRYRDAHTWMDPDADPDTKAAYKLPIARMADGELQAVFRGVVAAMAALNGARGGVDIPEEDRQGVYDHLSRYYAKAEQDPPELRAMVEEGPVRVAGFQDLPLEEGDRAWTWTAEEREAVLGESMDLQRFQRAHLTYSQDTPEDLESYAYPFARMVDGDLQVSMAAVRGLMESLVEESLDLQEDLRAAAYEHLSRYYVKAGEEPPAMTATQSSPVVAVDTRTSPCSNPPVGSDAQRGAPLAIHSPTAASEVKAMSEQNTTPEASTDVDRLSRLESLLERTVTTVAALVDAQSPTPSPEAPAPEAATPSQDGEVEILRARLQAMEATVTRMAQAPVRRGRPHAASVVRDLPSTGYGMVLREAAPHLPEGSALVAVCREQEGRRGADLSALPSRRSLEKDLRAILHAAMIDGVITDPDTRASWS